MEEVKRVWHSQENYDYCDDDKGIIYFKTKRNKKLGFLYKQDGILYLNTRFKRCYKEIHDIKHDYFEIIRIYRDYYDRSDFI